MGNVIEPILADCGISNRNQEEIKEMEEEIRKKLDKGEYSEEDLKNLNSFDETSKLREKMRLKLIENRSKPSNPALQKSTISKRNTKAGGSRAILGSGL
jgi:hypothetical protein